ncbi:MAG: ShlB/FhaC/HecB family hemolysin secretion/activation protein, partial [Candidatus Nitrotoga sp.]
SFTLKGLDIQGATVYPVSELNDLGKDLIGKKVTLSEVDSVARAIAQRYRDDGYLLVVAGAQDKSPKNGVVTIQVVEGYIANVTVDGRLHAGERGKKLVADIAHNITEERPLKAATLERYLLLIDDLPGVTAKGVVRPGNGRGQAELLIVADHDQFEGSVETNNRGTRFVGPNQFQGTLAANSVFGWFERTLIRGITTGAAKELQFYDAQHEQQLDDEGTKLKLFGSYSSVHPADELKVLDIDGESTSFDVQVESPIVRSRKENLTPRMRFSYRDSEATTLNVQTFKDNIRAVRAGGTYDVEDHLRGVNIFDTEISQGLDVLGATDDGVGRSRIDGEHDFTKINFDFTRLQPLPNHFSILTSLTGQYAFDPLLSAEEFSLGGVGFGQAYDPSELAGDHGAAAKIELRWANAVEEPWLQNYQLYTYYDVGSIWQKDPPAAVVKQKSLASAGVGVRVNINEHASGSLELSKPLTKNLGATLDDDPRVFFNLIGRF